MLTGHLDQMCCANDGLHGKGVRDIQPQAFLDTTGRHCFNKRVDKSGAGARKPGHGVHLPFFYPESDADGLKKVLGDPTVFLVDIQAGAKRSSPAPGQGRRVRHGAHHASLAAETSLKGCRGNSGENRNQQLVIVKGPVHLFQDLVQDLRFRRQDNDIADLDQRRIVLRAGNPLAVHHQITTLIIRFEKVDVLSRETAVQKTLDKGLSHISAAYETYFTYRRQRHSIHPFK